MFADENGCEHNLDRYFMLGDQHIAQCECGEKFRATTEHQVMRAHFHHAQAKVL